MERISHSVAMKLACRFVCNLVKAVWYLSFGVEEDEGS
jgi:hypothetical protein